MLLRFNLRLVGRLSYHALLICDPRSGNVCVSEREAHSPSYEYQDRAQGCEQSGRARFCEATYDFEAEN